MSEIKVVFWSGTGNTEEMAKAVAEGISAAGGEGKVIEVTEISADAVKADTVFALGCPAMGDEVLEEELFEPFMEALESGLSGKKVGLFGSYGWGDGEWMRNWEARVKEKGAVLVAEPVLANEAPDEEALAACRELGEKMTQV